jgi:hypothetical protein
MIVVFSQEPTLKSRTEGVNPDEGCNYRYNEICRLPNENESLVIGEDKRDYHGCGCEFTSGETYLSLIGPRDSCRAIGC